MHRITLTAIVISAKMYDDRYEENCFYAEVGMCDLWELNKMESAMLRKLDWKLMLTEQAMVLIKSQLLSMEYNSETKEYNFKRREIAKKKTIGNSNSAPKSTTIYNFHSRAEKKFFPGSRRLDGDSCEQWDFICCCEVLSKAHRKNEDPSSLRNKKTIQGVLSIYQTRIFIVRTVTQITTRIRVIPSQERPQS